MTDILQGSHDTVGSGLRRLILLVQSSHLVCQHAVVCLCSTSSRVPTLTAFGCISLTDDVLHPSLAKHLTRRVRFFGLIKGNVQMDDIAVFEPASKPERS